MLKEPSWPIREEPLDVEATGARLRTHTPPAWPEAVPQDTEDEKRVYCGRLRTPSDPNLQEMGDGFTMVRPSSTGTWWDAMDPTDGGDEAAGWVAYHEQDERDETKPQDWLDGFDLAASSGREPYAFTQESMRLQELRDELGTVEDFLHDVQERLDELEASRAELARTMGLFPTQVSRWFNGHVSMTLESMLAMREALEALEGEAV